MTTHVKSYFFALSQEIIESYVEHHYYLGVRISIHLVISTLALC